MRLEGEEAELKRLVERKSQRVERLPEGPLGRSGSAFIDPKDTIAANLASHHVRGAATDAAEPPFAVAGPEYG